MTPKTDQTDQTISHPSDPAGWVGEMGGYVTVPQRRTLWGHNGDPKADLVGLAPGG